MTKHLLSLKLTEACFFRLNRAQWRGSSFMQRLSSHLSIR